MLLGLFTLVALWADDLHRSQTLVVRSARWYRKRNVTFSDALAAVRPQVWADVALSISSSGAENSKRPRQIYDRLADLAYYAA